MPASNISVDWDLSNTASIESIFYEHCCLKTNDVNDADNVVFTSDRYKDLHDFLETL